MKVQNAQLAAAAKNVKAEVMEVTPEMAAKWLPMNAPTQRKRRDQFVERYARDLVNGSWELTHQGIGFDSQGRLIDGQHRLQAIMEAGLPMTMVVVTGLPVKAHSHIDIGFARTTTDVLHAQGIGWITTEHIAMARILEAGNIKSLTVARSPFETLEMVETHKAALCFVLQNLERRVRGITIAPVLAAVALAYYTERDRIRLAGFLRLLVSGVAIDPPRDKVAIHLRDWLRDNGQSSSSAGRMEVFLKTQRVIKAYMNGEKLTKLYTPSEPCYHLKQRATVELV